MSWIDRIQEAERHPDLVVEEADFVAHLTPLRCWVQRHESDGYHAAVETLPAMILPTAYAVGSGIVEIEGRRYWATPASGQASLTVYVGGPWEGLVTFPYRHTYVD